MSINTRGNKIPRPAGDFEQQLDRQMGYLRRSCAAFDAGEFDEAVRIALTIRVLVHNTSQSTSLLTHLGIQNALSYIDTGVYRAPLEAAMREDLRIDPGDFILINPVHVGLVETGCVGEGKVGWYAPLRLQRFITGTAPHRATRGTAPFDAWWNDPLVESSSRKTFSRSNLVLIMANQDGGGHVDANIDADYRDLIIDPLMQAEYGPYARDVATSGDDIPEVLHNVAFASVRQIAFELMLTIDRYQYVKDNPGILVSANPFGGLPIPAPPHRPIQVAVPFIIGTPE